MGCLALTPSPGDDPQRIAPRLKSGCCVASSLPCISTATGIPRPS